MKKLMVLLLTIVMVASFAGCASSNLKKDDKEPANAGEEQGNTNNGEKETTDELKVAKAIDLNIALGNNQRTITYQQSTPLKLPDGRVITQGELKPVWQFIQDKLGIQLNDITVQDQRASEMMDTAAATGFSNSIIYGGDNVAERLMNFGAQGYFINLKEHLDIMPNFAKYLSDNPDISKAITAYNGGIYHVPYVAEINNYARVFNGRASWVTALLDSKDALENETATLKVHYKGYWTTRHADNVIALQNEAANNGTLNRETALNTLLTYITKTYPDLAKPSDLFLGETAQYDIDELIALLRIVELSPNTLSKVSTGSVVKDTQISPFFVRKSRYREDVLRLITYFGGQRVHGSDSYKSRFYLDEKGELQFSYAQDDFIEGLGYIRDMFDEGLIHSEFSDESNRDDFRKELYTKDKEEGHRQFGFMTFDWIASTTASNEDVVGILPPVTTIGSDEFIHFVENTRAIKPGGWGIASVAKEEEINAAAMVIDYFFTEEGNILQNYGIPENLIEGEMFVAPSGIEYPKFNQWLLDAANEYKNGDVSGFLRDFMGSHIPIGYAKEIGFELQYTKNHGWAAWDLYETADVLSTSYDAENPLFKLIPPVFSLTEQDSAKLGTVSIGDDQVDTIFLYVTGNEKLTDATDVKKYYEDSGLNQHVQVYRDAYKRMTE